MSGKFWTKAASWGGYGALSMLYLYLAFFCLLFAYQIGKGYLFADPATWTKLPGLNAFFLPSFGMYLHWIGGFTILILGLIQLFPISRRIMIVHRCIGTAYIVAAICTSLGGNLFIYTHGCVGGLNMNIAFSIAGWVMFVLAIFTYYHARMGHRQQHRNFAIRLWSQGIASAMYRMWYAVLSFGGYKTSSWKDFHRPIDEVLDWWFFVPNLIIAEIVVFYLNRKDELKKSENEPLLAH